MLKKQERKKVLIIGEYGVIDQLYLPWFFK